MILTLRPEVEEDLVTLSPSVKEASLSFIDSTRKRMERAISEETAKQIYVSACSDLSRIGKVSPLLALSHDHDRIQSALVNLLEQKIQEFRKAQWN